MYKIRFAAKKRVLSIGYANFLMICAIDSTLAHYFLTHSDMLVERVKWLGEPDK